MPKRASSSDKESATTSSTLSAVKKTSSKVKKTTPATAPAVELGVDLFDDLALPVIPTKEGPTPRPSRDLAARLQAELRADDQADNQAEDQADNQASTPANSQADDQTNTSDSPSVNKPIPVIPVQPLATRSGATEHRQSSSQSDYRESAGNRIEPGNRLDNGYSNGNRNGDGDRSYRGRRSYNNSNKNGQGYGKNGQGYSNSNGGQNFNSQNYSSNQSYSNQNYEQGNYSPTRRTDGAQPDVATHTITGFLDTSRDGHGVLRLGMSTIHDKDAYISTSQIRRFKLRPGDHVEGPGREPKENERYWGLLKVDVVNGQPVEEFLKKDRVKFHSLTPVYPDKKIKLEIGDEPLSLRIIDLIAPIGRGQRSLIVSPPKAGKTTLLKDIATGIAENHPEIHLMAVLVGERPEEVTDIRRHLERITKGKGETASSNFDEQPEEQCRVAELALERAKRLVEEGKDVVILLDSITRLARAYNLSIPTSGRTLSGGFDPAAIHPTKQFFGAARNFEVNSSLTIIGTALVDTGSRMDEVIFEEFKGTGNQEIILDRRLSERRVFPSVDVQRSGTRRDDLLMDSMTYQSIMTLQRMLDTLDKEERTITLIEQLKRTKTNKEFLASLKAG